MQANRASENIRQAAQEKSNEPEAGMGSDTEIGVMEPSESLFSNNSHQEN